MPGRCKMSWMQPGASKYCRVGMMVVVPCCPRPVQALAAAFGGCRCMVPRRVCDSLHPVSASGNMPGIREATCGFGQAPDCRKDGEAEQQCSNTWWWYAGLKGETKAALESRPVTVASYVVTMWIRKTFDGRNATRGVPGDGCIYILEEHLGLTLPGVRLKSCQIVVEPEVYV